MATFNIKENDTSPAILYALTPTSVVLTGAAVVFRMRPVGSITWTLTGSAVVVTETVTPTVRYDWASADTATPGFYEGEFVVTYTDDTVETFPNNEFITVNIVGDESGLSERINNVRFLVGDTDSDSYEISNENVSFALTQAGDDVYLAAAICARAIAAKYATYVDTRVESVSSNYSQLQSNYSKLAIKLEAQAKKFGSSGLGIPAAGGLTYSSIDAADEDTDRVKPKFRQDQFAWPPRDPDDYPYS